MPFEMLGLTQKILMLDIAAMLLLLLFKERQELDRTSSGK